MTRRLAAFILIWISLLCTVLLCPVTLRAAEIKGKVANAAGGEPLGRVQVSVLEAGRNAVTAADGTFAIQNLAPGSYTLRVNAVGYRLSTVSFLLSAPEELKEFSLALIPDNFRHTESVQVKGDIFQQEDSPAVSETNLTASEIREASTVFADDPFRAVQALPGVSAPGNNEFYAQFSVMGTPFQNVSIYLDDVLATPFHSIPDISNGASLSLLTSETVEEMKLMPVAYPVKFADGIGAALDIRTREGSRSAPLFRASAGIADSDILGEGQLGGAKKGSWIASARKSYIGYLIRNRENDVQDVSFYDADLKLTYDFTPKHSVSLHALGGQTYTQLTGNSSNPDAFATGNSTFTLVRAGWRWGVTPHLLLDSHAAYLSEPYDSHNSSGQLLDSYSYGEWLGGTRATWEWKNNDVLEGGATLRRLRDSGYSAFFNGTGPQFFSSADGTGLRGSVYLQQASSAMKNRLHLMAGVRWDNLQRIGVHPFSEQISAAVRVAVATELQFGVGRYAQFPDFQQVATTYCFPFGNLLQRSDHFTAAIEQRLGESIRARIQVFDRQNADLIGSPSGFSPQLPPLGPPCGAVEPLRGTSTYQRDYSRGVQFVLQRRSANRLSGWLGYTLAQARQRGYSVFLPISQSAGEPFSFNSPYFSTLQDQRHSLNGFGTYRLTPTISLSGKFLYGSGYPVPSGNFVQVGNTYQEVGINTVHLPAYTRFDLRCDKSWVLNRWKLTLYGEVLNLTNHDNRFYAYSTGINPNTGQTTIQTRQELPITPTAGLVFEF
jgi:hypothetical protein